MTASRDAREFSLFSLAWPIFAEQGLRILLGTIDTLMVSQISDGAVAAVGVATQVLSLVLITFSFVGIGASVVVTHHLGANDAVGAERTARAAFGMSTWLGLITSACVAIAAGRVLLLLQLPPSLLPYGEPFLALMGGTLFLEAQNTAAAAVLRAHGNTRGVMVVMGLQNLINVAGNAVVLFGLFGMPRLGVQGVAMSGVASRLVCFFALRVLVRRSTGIDLKLRDYLALSLHPIRRIMSIGLPAGAEVASHWLALMIVTSFCSRMGEAAIATFSYAFQVIVWVFLFTNSIGLATEILVGHRIGGGQFDRVYRDVVGSVGKGVVLAAVVSGGLALAAPQVFGMFSRDPVIITAGVLLLHLGFPLEIGRAINVVVINALRATGDARFPLGITVFSVWGLWVPLAWLLGLHYQLGLAGIWIAMMSYEWVRGILMYARWAKRGWLEHAQRSRAQVYATTAPAADVA